VVKELQARLLLRDVSHLLDESFATITGDQRFYDLRRDLDWLRAQGKSVGVVFHGSDIRSPRLHLAREPFSYFQLLTDREQEEWENAASATRRLAIESGLPLFVSTPDLLLDLPEASWLPLVIDPSAWRPASQVFSHPKLRVLHVPSRRNPPIKGTSYVEPVLKRLAAEGLVEYLSPESVPHGQMPALVGSVDVVIDQILTGSYGVAAIEAMAAGRVVIGSIGVEVRERVGAQIPVVDSGPDGLEHAIRAIVADPDGYAATASQGPAFVAEHHSGARSADVLRGWLQGGPSGSTMPVPRPSRGR